MRHVPEPQPELLLQWRFPGLLLPRVQVSRRQVPMQCNQGILLLALRSSQWPCQRQDPAARPVKCVKNIILSTSLTYTHTPFRRNRRGRVSKKKIPQEVLGLRPDLWVIKKVPAPLKSICTHLQPHPRLMALILYNFGIGIIPKHHTRTYWQMTTRYQIR